MRSSMSLTILYSWSVTSLRPAWLTTSPSKPMPVMSLSLVLVARSVLLHAVEPAVVAVHVVRLRLVGARVVALGGDQGALELVERRDDAVLLLGPGLLEV